MTDPLGQSQILPYLVGLSKKGYTFTIISCEKKSLFNKKKETVYKVCDGAGILWEPILYTKFPPVVSTLWDLFKIFNTAEKLYKQRQFQIVHCRSYIASLVGLKLKRKYGIKFIFDMRGFWADERVDGNLWNLSNPVYKEVFHYFKKKEKDFLTESNQIISLTEAARKEILSWCVQNVNSEKITVIPCATDFSLFYSQNNNSKSKAKEMLGLKQDDFVLTYIGSLGTWYLLKDMLSFFKFLKYALPGAKFLFLTKDGNEIKNELVANEGLSMDDIIVRFADRKEIPRYAHATDLGIFFIKPAYSKKASSPTKLGEMFAMNLPVVCNNKVGDLEDILSLFESSYCIKNLTEETFQHTIREILLKRNFTEDIRRKAEEMFSLEICCEKYLEVYTELDKISKLAAKIAS